MSDFNENYNQNLKEETFGAKTGFAPEDIFRPNLSPEEQEIREIKKIGNIAGISMISLLVLSVILGVFLSISALIYGGETQALKLVEDPALGALIQVIFSMFSFTVPFIACYKIGGFRVSELVSLKKTDKSLSYTLFFFGLSLCAFANISAGYVDDIFRSVGIDYSMDIEMPEGFFGFLLSVISTALVPALVEEFAVRGLLLGSLRKFGDAFAVIASAICFGILHGNFEQIPFAALVGLFLGFTVVKTGSLRVAMGVHFANNLVSVLVSYFPAGNEIKNVIYFIYLIIALILGLLFLKSADAGLFTFEESQTKLDNGKKYKAFFLSGGIVVFIIVNLIEAVSLLII